MLRSPPIVRNVIPLWIVPGRGLMTRAEKRPSKKFSRDLSTLASVERRCFEHAACPHLIP